MSGAKLGKPHRCILEFTLLFITKINQIDIIVDVQRRELRAHKIGFVYHILTLNINNFKLKLLFEELLFSKEKGRKYSSRFTGNDANNPRKTSKRVLIVNFCYRMSP